VPRRQFSSNALAITRHAATAVVLEMGVRRIATPEGQPWVCVFLSRTSGRAEALFATEDQAQHFAERHARAFTSSRTSFRWVHTGTSSLLTIDIGEYLVTRIAQGTH
jgi:hypothetical protein